VRAVVVRGPNEYGVEDVPEPRYGDYEALVRISHCGICSGTDRHIISGRFPYIAPYPTILGHESIGRIVACGRAVRYLHEGDVVLRPMVAGDMGSFSSTFGGMAEWGVVNDACAILEDAPCTSARLPRPLRYQQVVPADFEPAGVGAFITFKETLSWAQDFGVGPGARVAVLGSGSVGLCFVRVCKLLGAEQVIAVGRHAPPLERAKAMGADAIVNTADVELHQGVRGTLGCQGCTHVIEAVGDNALLQTGLGLLSEGGRIGQYGVPPERSATLDWSTGPGTLSLHFIAPQEDRVHEQALDCLRLGFFDPMALTDAVVPLAEVHRAFALLDNHQAIRVTLSME
jgi:threonine dehydrogenase-like Zn-dependent dehydrogenase